jgi:hypothetical protein
MYKFIWLYDKIETYVIVGGIAFCIYQAVSKLSKERTKKICKIAFGVLFAFFIVASIFDIDDKIRKPDMDESLYSYTESVISLVDTAAEEDMPLESFTAILNGYVDSFNYTKSSSKRTKLEQDIYWNIFFIHDTLSVEYEAEFDRKWTNNYGYPLTWYDLDSDTKESIIELRNELAELIKLPPHYNEDDFERYDKLSYFD